MIIINKIVGVDPVKLTYSDLVAKFPITGWSMEDLGASSDATKHLKGLHRDLHTGKPVIFLNSSVHGNEWQGTFWTLQFARYIAQPNLIPTHSHFFEMLKNKYAWYWIPVANPSGYDLDTRDNSNGVNINSTFHTQSQPENVIISNKVLALKPVMLIDSHTWEDERAPCHGIGCYKNGYFDRTFYKDFLQNALSAISYCTEERVGNYPGDTHDASRLRSWSALQKSITGDNCLSWLIEADRLAPNNIQTTQGINAMLVFCLYFDALFTRQTLNPF